MLDGLLTEPSSSCLYSFCKFQVWTRVRSQCRFWNFMDVEWSTPLMSYLWSISTPYFVYFWNCLLYLYVGTWCM